MKAIILAAGQGIRLRKITQGILPKCLLHINTETLLERQIRILNSLGLKEIVTVVGNQGCWNKNTIRIAKAICDDVILNTECLTTQSPYSLHLALQHIGGRDSLVILDGDLVFEKELVELLLTDKRKNLIITYAMESGRINNKGSKVIAAQDRRVIYCRRNILSNRFYPGIFKVGEDVFELLKNIASKEAYWNEELPHLLEELCRQCPFYNLHVNTELSDIPPSTYKEPVFWEQIPSMVEKEGSFIYKKATTGREKLISEVNWIQNLPLDIRRHFPEILDYDFSCSPAYYKMKFYPYPTLKELLFHGSIDPKRAYNVIKMVLDFMFSKVYSKDQTPPHAGYVKHVHLEKVESRLQAAKSASSLFSRVIDASSIVINGVRRDNVLPLLGRISKDLEFLSTLEPPFLSIVHGDLKIDNMLINLGNNDFILIDPRGRSPAGLTVDDPIYDIAKIFTSYHGLYDLFCEHMVDLNIKDNDTQMTIDVKFRPSEVMNALAEISSRLYLLLPQYPQIKNDHNWEKRLFFTEAMLIIAYAPFYLLSTFPMNEKIAIGLYARGVQLLNEFLHEYPLDTNPKYKIINLNSVEDYEMAKEAFDSVKGLPKLEGTDAREVFMEDDALINLLREVKEVLDKYGIEFWLGGGTLLGAVRNGKVIPWEHDVDLDTWDTNLSSEVKRLVAKELSDKGFETQIFETPTPHINIRYREKEVWVDLTFWHLINDKAILPRAEIRKFIGTFLLYFSTALLKPDYYDVNFGTKPEIDSFIMRILVKISRALPSYFRKRLAQIVTAVYQKIGVRDVSLVIPADYFRHLSTMTFYGMEFRVQAEKEDFLAYRFGEDWRIPREDWITSRDDGAVINTKWRKREKAR